MAVIKFDSSAPLIRGWNFDRDLLLTFRRDDVVVGSPIVAGPTVLGDFSYNTVQSAAVARSWRYSTEDPLDATPVQIENLNPDLVTISGDRITSIADGLATLRVSKAFGSRNYSLQADVSSGTTYELVGYTAGSLASHVDTLMRSLFIGQTLNNTTAFLSVGWPPNYPANPNRIAPSLDLTPVSLLRQPVGESGWTPLYPDLLISPRHAIVTSHAAGFVGDQVLFRRPDNSLQWVTRTAIQPIGSDTAIVYYDQPVSGVTPAKLAPGSLADKLPNLPSNLSEQDFVQEAWRMPCVHLLVNGYPHLGLNPGRKILVTMLQSSRPGYGTDRYMEYVRATGTDFEPYGVQIQGSDSDGIRNNDSGSLLLAPVQETSGGPVSAMFLSHCLGPYSGPNYSALLDLINAAMNTLAGTAPGTYAAQTVNLSRLPSY